MRILLLFFLVLNISLLSAQVSLSKIIDFELNGETTGEALIKLSEQTGIDIAYSNNFFKQKKELNFDFRAQTIESILQKILLLQGVNFKCANNRIILFRSKPQFYTISGYIKDADSGERLISATVFCPEFQKGTTSNEYGFYSLTLPKGVFAIEYSYIGYQTIEKTIELNKNIEETLALPSSLMLTEVIVRPDKNTQNRNNSVADFRSSKNLPLNSLKDSPSLGGENDIVRASSLLAGVQMGADGLGGTQIRGSESGQNLMLLDGVQVYIPYHALGLFSIYNTETIKSAKLIKGSFSPKYGGGLAAVYDVRTREGNLQKWSGVAKAGLLSSNVLIEGPLLKNKASILVAGRLGYTNVLLAPFLQSTYFRVDTDELETGFNDFNIKLNYAFSDKNHLYASLYKSSDYFENHWEDEISDDFIMDKEESTMRMNWSNSIFSLRWNHLFSEKLFANTTLTYSDFKHEFSSLNVQESLEFYGYGYGTSGEHGYATFQSLYFSKNESDNRDIGLKIDFDYLPNAKHNLHFGIGTAHKEFIPSFSIFDEEDIEIEELDDLTIDAFDNIIEKDTYSGVESFAYIEDKLKLNSKIQLNIGLRASHFINLIDQTAYFNLEPRLSAQYAFSPNLQLRAAASRMVQYLHLVSSPAMRLPNDVYYPSGKDILPQTSIQTEVGFDWQFSPRWLLSVEAYSKSLENLYIYPELYNLGSTVNETLPADILVKGNGTAKGLESTLYFHDMKLEACLSYTLAQSNRIVDYRNSPEIVFSEQGGIIFEQGEIESAAFAYDHRHQFKFYAAYSLLPQLKLGVNVLYNSPNPQLTIQSLDENGESLSVLFFGEALSEEEELERSEPYFRVDANVNYQIVRPRFQHQFKLGVYNLTNHQNVAYYRYSFLNSGGYNPDFEFEANPVYSIPFMPSFSYTFRF